MKDDLVSKAVVIDAICDEFSKVYCNNCAYKSVIGDPCDDCDRKNMKWSAERKTVERVVEELPSAQTGWISTSVRLPKDNEEVLFCDNEGERWLGWHYGFWKTERLDFDEDEVVVWMPLPLSYHSEGGKE